MGYVSTEHADFGDDECHWFVSSSLYEGKLVGESRRGDLRAKQPVIRWLTASKKKNLETWKVLTSMPKLAATMAMRAMMLQTRMILRTT